MKILIDISSGFNRNSIIANNKKNKLTINGKKVDFDVDRFIFKVCNITMNWPDKLEIKDIIDGCKVHIVIKDQIIIKEINYDGRLPDNFYLLEKLINEVCNVEREQQTNS